MSDEIRPALTPEDWKRGTAAGGWYERTDRGVVYNGNDAERSFLIDKGDERGVAALLLYDQPFGFTQEDVDALLYTLGDAAKCGTDDRLRSIAAKIAALLPPPPS